MIKNGQIESFSTSALMDSMWLLCQLVAEHNACTNSMTQLVSSSGLASSSSSPSPLLSSSYRYTSTSSNNNNAKATCGGGGATKKADELTSGAAV